MIAPVQRDAVHCRQDIICPADISGGMIKNLDDQHLVMAGEDDNNRVFEFNMVTGFTQIAATFENHGLGAVAVTPRKYAECRSL